jgi:uncharacterized protein (TIGR01777 family)
MKKAVLAGGSGFLGQALARSLSADGYDVVVLGRSAASRDASGRFVVWDGRKLGDWKSELEGAEALFNLTGRSVDCRYTKENRDLILNSRIDSTRVLGQAVQGCADPPKVWLNSSTATIYKDRRGDLEPHDESSNDFGSGFSVGVAQAWEEAFEDSVVEGVRKVVLRVSIALGKDGGAFPVMRRFAKLGLGGAQGPGSQWVSWLHVDDWVGVARFLMAREDLSGPVNLAAPNPVTNSEFMKGMRRRFAPLGIGLPAPSFAVCLGAVFMRTAPELVLKSRKVVSSVLAESGYRFKYPELAGALESLSV